MCKCNYSSCVAFIELATTRFNDGPQRKYHSVVVFFEPAIFNDDTQCGGVLLLRIAIFNNRTQCGGVLRTAIFKEVMSFIGVVLGTGNN